MIALLTQIVSLFYSALVWLWPLKYCVVHPGEAGVRFRRGHPQLFPATGVFYGTTGDILCCHQVVGISLDTSEVATLTKDFVPMSVDSVVVYDVVDLVKALTVVDDYGAHVDAVTNDHIRATIQDHSFAELVRKTDTFQSWVVENATDDLDFCGVVVNSVRLNRIEVTDPFASFVCSANGLAGTLGKALTKLKTYGISTGEAACLLSGRTTPTVHPHSKSETDAESHT